MEDHESWAEAYIVNFLNRPCFYKRGVDIKAFGLMGEARAAILLRHLDLGRLRERDYVKKVLAATPPGGKDAMTLLNRLMENVSSDEDRAGVQATMDYIFGPGRE